MKVLILFSIFVLSFAKPKSVPDVAYGNGKIIGGQEAEPRKF